MRFFFFNDTATTEIYTLSLHDALPICGLDEREEIVRRHRDRHGSQLRLLGESNGGVHDAPRRRSCDPCRSRWRRDRKSTRLNSSHSQISYAVFCLQKKINKTAIDR